jgi:hypothetical protein
MGTVNLRFKKAAMLLFDSSLRETGPGTLLIMGISHPVIPGLCLPVNLRFKP